MSQDNNPFGNAAPAPQQQAANPYAAAPNGSTSSAPPQNPYAAPRANVVTGAGQDGEKQSLMKLLFSFNGRIPRKAYWLAYLGVMVVYGLSVTIQEWIILLTFIPVIWSALALGTKRLHDTDRSGWWQLIAIIPLVGLVLLYWFMTRGTEGPNRFGGDATGMY
jgi:uncharacterized membrane protein YhaH (DUF805 family)